MATCDIESFVHVRSPPVAPVLMPTPYFFLLCTSFTTKQQPARLCTHSGVSTNLPHLLDESSRRVGACPPFLSVFAPQTTPQDGYCPGAAADCQ